MSREFVIDCSVPPSVNRLWRFGNRRVYKDKRHDAWLKEFWFAWYKVKPRCFKPIKSQFDAEILICPKRKRDADNSAKAVLDAAQKLGIFVNDGQARRVVQELVTQDRAPLGCRLRILPIGS